MDSGNSGSIQSSSGGGDEEYDSRAESISSFLTPSAHTGPITNQQYRQQQPPPPPSPPRPRPTPHHHHHPHNPNSSIFDPLTSNFFDPFLLSRSSSLSTLSNPNSLLNFDTVWSKTLRSEPNCTQTNPILASTSSIQPFFDSQNQPRGPFPTSSSPVTPFPPVLSENTTPRVLSSSADQSLTVRNPKKRSRASRRAPTTVLTTDTTNFRAMVQEFTGIPAPPFTSSPFPRTRFDLFGTPSNMRSYPLGLDASSSQPPYLLRPFAQKFQPLPFVSPPPPPSSSSPSPSSSLSSSFLSSSMANAIASINPKPITSGTSTTTNLSASLSPSVNFQLPSELGLSKQTQSLHNIQNTISTFQSLHHQSSPRFRLSNPANLDSKTQGSSMEIPSANSHLKMGVLDEFGFSHGHVNHTQLAGLANPFSSDGTTAGNSGNTTTWAGGLGSDETNQSHLRSDNDLNYRYSESVNNGKLNFSASSSNFHVEKGSENVPARGEGMVEPWICSSDL